VHQAAPRSSYALGGSRAPKRPVLELPAEDEFELPAEAEVADEPQAADGFGAAPEDEALDLGAMPTAYGDAEDEGEEEYDDDVEGIVDPLAGLRNDEPEQYQPAPQGYGAEAAEDQASDAELWGSDGDGNEAEPQGSGASAGQDELLLDADRLAAEDEPVKPMLGGGRRRGLVSGGGEGAGGGGGSSAGSTLFERMANLSRGGSKASDEDEEEGDDEGDSGSASLSIPRFLGRQNNQ
jgi:cell division protein FtsZ